MAERYDVVVAGGGIVGLSAAYALAREGVSVAVLDRREPGREASWAGAGLLPARSDPDRRPSHPTLQLRAWSASLYPEWSEALREETGIDNGYRRTGGVDVARTEAEEHALRTTAGRWRVEGIAYERLAPGDYTRVEPALDPSLRAVYFLPDRAQVRNPWHLRALAEAIAKRGGVVLPRRGVEGFTTRGDRVTGVRTGDGPIEADHVIVAAGAWSGGLLADLGVRAPTPPVKGQIVLLNGGRPLLRRIVEHGRHYLVPREDGRILIGATEEDAGFDVLPTADAFHGLLEAAWSLCPALRDAEIEATWAGLRPGSLDTRPYIGPAPGFRNLIVAAGHKRAGLQLSPATAELVADVVLGRIPRIDLSYFRIDREPAPAGDDVFRS
ncbi:glycine oxidase ThiO [Planctomyces sp. SH-PL62]|uniref:glycine oxidase ThiO n=1 Tax=Planctomyces sp. SH-PL62 TaxID=1636152 RepID=UPI00078C5F2C|nr:glycine oxidase ThiO [Planctomyces sp. SH-PL62]AMV40103.1 Hydrogen cyanide synthase subunit HcnC precursor [Planctomyces sp. SH-PL62]